MKSVLRSRIVDPILESARGENTSNPAMRVSPDIAPRPGKANEPPFGFWSNRWTRLIQWVSQKPWLRLLAWRTTAENPEPLEPYSGLRNLRESDSYSALQRTVDDSQAALDCGSIHQLVDLALFSEVEASRPS